MAVKHPESQALVNEIRERLGARNARDLAAAIGMTGLDDERRVRAWLAGTSAPNFYGTMALLRAAGQLVDEPATRRGRSRAEEAQLASAIDEVTSALESLRQRLLRLQQPAAEQEPPQRGRRRG